MIKAVCLLLPVLVLAAGCSRPQEYTAADLIRTLKEHNDADMCGWAARELGRVPRQDAPACVKPLTEALQDPHDDVRMAAAYALADLGKDAAPAVPALKKLSQDGAPQVRQAVAYAVKEIQRAK